MLIFEITKTNTPLPQKGLTPILIAPPHTYAHFQRLLYRVQSKKTLAVAACRVRCRHGVVTNYQEEPKQPQRPIAGLPLLEFSPALESWSDIYTGLALSFRRRFPLLFFFICLLYLSVTRLGCALNALSSISRVDTPLTADWLKVCFGTRPRLSFLKGFGKITSPTFNLLHG